MKKILLAATILLCITSSLFAEGFVYPTPKAGGPAVSCPGCPSPRTHPSGSLGKVWPYDDPIIGFHRFLDSVWINDYQQPFRTARAFEAFHVPERDRVYMLIGSALVAYDTNSFITRLEGRENLTAGATRKDGKDLYLKGSKYFYAEDPATGWEVVVMDGQDRLIDFDWDDRNNVYLAYAQFGWGIVRDDGGSDGRLMQSVSQVYGDGSPFAIFVLKTSNNKYYAYTGGPGASDMKAYDVTDAANPVRRSNLDPGFQPTLYAKGTDHFAYVSNGKVHLYTNDGFVNRQGPIETLDGAAYAAIASDGNRFFAAGFKNNKLAIATISISQGVVTETVTQHDSSFFTQDMEFGDGYLTLFNYEDVKLFKVSSTGQTEVPLNEFVAKYYKRPPTGYISPESGRVKHAAPAVINQKLYLMLSAYSVGDLIEIRSDDAINVELSGSTAGNIFYGDKVGFVAKSSSETPKSVSWSFGNSEGAAPNATTSTTGQTVYHIFSGLTSGSNVTKNVRATTADAEASLNVTLKPPTAAFTITGTSFLFTQPNASSSAAIVFGDTFADESDGDSGGHYVNWTIDGTPNAKRPNELMDVGACGAHSLNFSAHWGVVSGTPPTAAGQFVRSISPFNYSVRPFAAAITGPTAAGSSAIRFTSSSRFSAGLGLTAANVTHQWDLINSNDVVLLAGPAGVTTWDVPKSLVQNGSRVRLKLTSGAITGSCAGLTESVAYSAPLSPPDPQISGGCATDGGPPCVFQVTSPSGQTGWEYDWSVAPSGGVSASSYSSSTFKPNFSEKGSYTVKVKATSPIGVGEDSKTQVVNVVGSTCKEMGPVTVFIDYSGPSSSCRPTSGNCSTSEQIRFSVEPGFGYDFGCADHTFKWTFPGGFTSTSRTVSRQLSAGTHTVKVLIDNEAEEYEATQVVKVGGSTPNPNPNPNPNPTPNPGGCGTMTAANVWVTYSEPTTGCNQLNGSSCAANSEMTFKANADRLLGYNFDCATHTFSWTIDGQTKTGDTIKHKFTTNGRKNVSVKITRGTTSFTASASFTIAGATPGPNPNPTPTACGTMTPANVYIDFHDAARTCNQLGGACPVQQQLSFTATADRLLGYDFACATHTFEWEFPGPVKKNGQSVQHAFASNGTYPVKVKVNNGTTTFEATANVLVGGIPATPEVEIVTISKEFLGNGIYEFTPVIQPPDAVSAVVTYAWDFGDGSAVINTPSAAPVTHRYQEACGDCNVTLSLYNRTGQLVMPPIIEPLGGSRRRGARH